MIIGDFCPRSCRRPPKMLRHQYFAYHALIRLAPIRVSGENHLDSRALPDRPARLCAITPTPLLGLTVIVADQRPFDELMVVLRDLHMGEALPIPARIPPLPRAQRHGQRLPAGDGPGTGAGLRGVGDGGEQPAQLTAADSSPRCSKAARIAAASASVTTIMPAGWVCASKTASSP